MNSMDPDTGEASKSLIDKVRKLLAMAEGASNVNEADAFSRKAAELIAVYRIDPARLAAAADDRLTVRSFPIGRGAYVRARLALLQIDRRGELVPARLAGRARRVPSPSSPASRATSTRRRCSTRRCTRRRRAGCRPSVAARAPPRNDGVARSSSATRTRWARCCSAPTKRRRPRRAPSSANAALPALRARERQVADYARTAFGRVVSARPASAATVTGWQAGQTAAARADVGRRGIGALRAIGAGS